MLLAPALQMHGGKKHHENLKSRWQHLTSEVIATLELSGNSRKRAKACCLLPLLQHN
jgi:hypothetical protein